MAGGMNVTTDPSGLFVFETPEGKRVPLIGQGAAELADWVTKNKKTTLPPQIARENAAPGDYVPLPGGFQPDPEATAAARADAAQQHAAAAVQEAQIPPLGAVPGSPAAAPVSAGASRSPTDQAALMGLLTQKEYVPGRAAVDPSRMAREGVPVPVAKVVSGGVEETPDQKAERETAMKEMRAQRAAAGAAADEVTAAAEERRTAALNATIQADIQAREAEQKIATARNAWDTRAAQLSKMNDQIAKMEVSPDRVWENKSTAQKVFSIIGVALGAWASTYRGTRNFAADALDAEINRDIESQRAAIETKKGAQQNALRMFQEKYGFDLQESIAAAKATQLRYAAAQTDLLAARAGSAEAKMNAANLKADLLGKAMAQEAELAERFQGRVTTQMSVIQPQAAVAGGYRDPSIATLGKRAEALGKVDALMGGGQGKAEDRRAALQEQQANLERRVTLPDGSFAWATTEKRANSASAVYNATEILKRNLARQRAILDETGSSWRPELKGEYETLVANNKVQAKNLFDLGAIAAADVPIVEGTTGAGANDLTALKSKGLAGMKSAEQTLDKIHEQTTRELFKDPAAQQAIRPSEAKLGIKEIVK